MDAESCTAVLYILTNSVQEFIFGDVVDFEVFLWCGETNYKTENKLLIIVQKH